MKENFNSLVNIATEVEVLASEFQKSKASVETISLVMDEGLQDFSFFSPLIHVSTLWCSVYSLASFISVRGSKSRQ